MKQMTKDQSTAIAYRGNLLVSAAAGAGKTFVLSERICRIILDGTPIGELLVLTFTKAAAAEMKTRIEKRLREYIAEKDLPEGVVLTDETKRFLRAQAANMGAAYIMTFDSFCGRVLRRYGYLINIPSSYRIIDDLEKMQRADRVKDRLLTECGETEDKDWQALLTAFNGEEGAWTCVERVSRAMDSLPQPEQWLHDATETYGNEAQIKHALDTLVEEAKRDLKQKYDMLKTARDMLDPSAVKAGQTLDLKLEATKVALDSTGYDAYRENLNYAAQVNKENILRWDKGFPKEDQEDSKDAHEKLKKCVSAQQTEFTLTAAEEVYQSLRVKPVMEGLEHIVLRFRDMFRADKQLGGCLDYADMEHFSLKLFTEKEGVREEYKNKFRYIAVDEYQDTNGVQEELIKKIARDDNLFFVGDIKQSIYRFRNADPGLFIRKRSDYSGEPGAKGKTILLRENFRSTQEVIGSVNELFSAIMNRETCSIPYGEEEALVQGANFETEGGAELVLIEQNPAGAEDKSDYAAGESDGEEGSGEENGEDGQPSAKEELENINGAQAEARFIARRIKQLLGNVQVPHGDTTRSLTYKDIAILMRNKGNAQDYVSTLAQEGIPCYAQMEGGYFDTVEVMLVLDILRVVDNRRQDIPLLAVMRSSVGGFSMVDLANIRLRTRDKGATFFDALLLTAEEENALGQGETGGSLPSRCNRFLSRLERWHRSAQLMPLSQWISVILTESGLYAEMGALVDGKRRQANLDALIDAASRFEQGHFFGIHAFLNYVEHGGKGNVSLSAAQQMEADVVRLMTVHGSKGLEFPVVFYADLGKKINDADVKDSIQIGTAATEKNALSGIGLKMLDEDGIQYETVLWRAMKSQTKRESWAEEMRVLYVGMTRARQMLILSGSTKGAQKLVDKADTSPDADHVMSVSKPLEWVLMGSRGTLGKATVYPRETFLNGAEGREYPEIPTVSEEECNAFNNYMESVPSLCAEASIPLKVGVSTVIKKEETEASAREEENRDPFQTPAFAQQPGTEPGLTAAERGTAVHTAAANLLPKRYNPGEMELFLDGLLNRGIISKRQREVIPASMLIRLTETPLWERLAVSPRVERELPFSLPVPAKEVLDTQSEKAVLLQGVIDCCFMEGDGWVLVDYKTDRVPRGTALRDVAMRHKPQMDYYQRALETLTATKVKARYILLLSVGEAVEV